MTVINSLVILQCFCGIIGMGCVTDGIEGLVLQMVGLQFQDLTKLAGKLQAYVDLIEEVKLWDEG